MTPIEQTNRLHQLVIQAVQLDQNDASKSGQLLLLEQWLCAIVLEANDEVFPVEQPVNLESLFERKQHWFVERLKRLWFEPGTWAYELRLERIHFYTPAKSVDASNLIASSSVESPSFETWIAEIETLIHELREFNQEY